MTDERSQSQVDALVEHEPAGNPQDAANSLGKPSVAVGEGSKADPEALPISEDDIWKLCQSCKSSGDALVLEKALSIARNDDFSSSTASAALESLFQIDSRNVQGRDQLVGQILARPNGRSALASRLASDPTATFRMLSTLGEASVDGLARTCTSIEAWPNTEAQTKGARDIFQLLLAMLLEVAQDKLEMGIRAIARLMMTSSADIQDLIDAHILEIIFSFLDVQQPVVLRSQATLVTAKFLEASKQRGHKLLEDYVISRISKQKIDDIVAGFSVAAAIFPIVPEPASSLFLTPGFIDDVLAAVQKSKSKRLRQAALELLSAACINQDCRLTIKSKCTDWLMRVVRDVPMDAAMAGLVLSKTGQELSKAPDTNDSEDLTAMFKKLVLDTDGAYLQTAIEGLAYSSMRPSNEAGTTYDTQLLKALANAMTKPENRGSLVFGALTVFSNLTTYPPEISAEQQRMEQLKAYANQSKITKPNTAEDARCITARCKQALDAGIIPAVGKIVKHVSPTLLGLVSTIILSLSKERKHCGIMVQQGVLDIILPLVSYDGSDNTLTAVRKTAAQALARIVIPIDPFLMFSNYQNTPNARSISNAVRSFKALLEDHEAQDPRPAFEALQALTNLASMGEEVCDYITTMSFSSIEFHLTSSRSALQQASIECISNLSMCDSCVDKFVVDAKTEPEFPAAQSVENEDSHPKESRFLKLRLLSEEGVRGAKLAAMATFFNIAQVEPGVRMILRSPSGLERLVEQLEAAQNADKVDEDMLTRIVGVVCNVLQHGGLPARQGLRSLDLEILLDDINMIGGEESQLKSFKIEALRLLKQDKA